MNVCTLKNLTKRYGPRTVLDIDELDLAEGEFFVLVGPSGSGKTTLLRIVAGLIQPTRGEVILDGRSAKGLAPHLRKIGVVFQGLALWPHMSVRGNIALGLEHVVRDAAERTRRIEETARELSIENHLASRPTRLSGGERQRVAIARALVRRPKLLLLDEPFSDLDARLRRSIARLVRDLHDQHGMSTLLITHDRTDAHLLADRIGVMKDGKLLACDRPGALYEEPGSPFVAEFLTDAAILSGRVGDDGMVQTVLGRLALTETVEAGRTVHVAVRPDEIVVGQGPVPGRVIACEFLGGSWRYRVTVGSGEVAVLHDQPLAPGQEVRLSTPHGSRQVLRVES
ncbi:MAG: ABC transporter ATP-binding protein [Planctomycetota bacterium]|nr:ABC transporter ATP-binding protein [Planctomycetota bacterium]